MKKLLIFIKGHIGENRIVRRWKKHRYNALKKWLQDKGEIQEDCGISYSEYIRQFGIK